LLAKSKFGSNLGATNIVASRALRIPVSFLAVLSLASSLRLAAFFPSFFLREN